MNAACIALVPLDELSPESAYSDAIEEEIQRSLPAITGMDTAHTAEERAAAYANAIKAQRDEFVALYGEPFGLERRSESRNEPDLSRRIVQRALMTVI